MNDKLRLIRQRDLFLREIRGFFHEKGFLEVDPPLLVTSAGMEPHLDPFVARGAETGQAFFLPTSPEFYLKKVMAMGAEKVFSLAPSFRDEPVSRNHSPQFLMLEWYRSEAGLKDLVRDIEELLRRIESHFEHPGLRNHEGVPISLSDGVEVLELDQAFEDWTGKRISSAGSEEDWRRLASVFGAGDTGAWSENDCFSFLTVEVIERKLAAFRRPVVLMGYPRFQSALAEFRSDGMADRFELYVGGVELANAYNELVGRDRNYERYLMFQEQRSRMKKDAHPEDAAFFDAVDRMPPSAGIALGADRFLSLLLGCRMEECRNV